MNDQTRTEEWLSQQELEGVPLCTSVDIRDAGFKMAVVDTNLFPAGFNNLCGLSLDEASLIFREAIESKHPHCQSVVIVAEEHTRNAWYLQNVFSLQQLIEKAGYHVKVVAPLVVEPEVFCENISKLELTTALGDTLQVYPLDAFVECQKKGRDDVDLVIVNNDLIEGIPQSLLNLDLPIYPSLMAGWHVRRKSSHFAHMNEVVANFTREQGLDPWLHSCLFRVCERVDINNFDDRHRIAQEAEALLQEIQTKYDEYGITQKPFLFLKADYGTYGMGVQAIEEPQEIIDFNRKMRNKMHKGKSARVIDQFLLQEGVPSALEVEGKTSEVCLYQLNNCFIGAFYRVHGDKNDRQNLNAQGMCFRKICAEGDHAHRERCEQNCYLDHKAENLEKYKILARLAGIAAYQEIQEILMAQA